ncbi:MAG: hypothetical protein RLZZ618_2863 [Pseudomonadota bacterium]|jgi:uncharacterized membrane protein
MSAASSLSDDRPDYRTPGTVDELTQENVQAIDRLERAAHAHMSSVDRLADRISSFGGSTHFLWVHVLLFSSWITLNVWPGADHFDPYPFTFLTLVVSLEAIFLSAFILISQNQAARISDRRNHLDLQINLLTEQENTKMLVLLQRIAEKMGIEDCDDPSLRVLEQAMRPEKLVEQIDAAMARQQSAED